MENVMDLLRALAKPGVPQMDANSIISLSHKIMHADEAKDLGPAGLSYALAVLLGTVVGEFAGENARDIMDELMEVADGSFRSASKR